MITSFTATGLMIFPETEFERQYLESFEKTEIKVKYKTGLSLSDFIGIELTKTIKNNE
tara:strand:- start:1501 stop:1674 length:174 start_codon:yes stop_codon:yes gene_type:complete